MSIVTGLTAARMLAMEAASVVSGAISGDNLILTKHDGSTINAGNVRGPKGDPGLGFDNFSGRNRIINGDFRVNQRSFTSSTVANTFGHDRWLFNYVSGTCTYSNQNPTLGSLPESPKNNARIVTAGQSGVTAFALLLQKIEDVRTFSGKTVTVSFWASARVGTPSIGIEFSQYFGSGGSPSATISTPAGKVQISTTWTRYSLTVTLPSISGKTLGSDNNDCLQLAIWVSAGSNYNTQTTTIGVQNNTFDIWGVQVEEGSVLTNYEQKSYTNELRDCQRYFNVISESQRFSDSGWCASASVAYAWYRYPVSMRAIPTLSVVGTVNLSDLYTTYSATFSLNSTTNRNGAFITASSAGLTVGRYAYFATNSESSISFNAEL